MKQSLFTIQYSDGRIDQVRTLKAVASSIRMYGKSAKVYEHIGNIGKQFIAEFNVREVK